MTTPIEESLRRLVRDCSALELQWALIGGFAVSARAEPRFTRDVDACVLVNDDADAEAIVLRLRDAGYGVESLVEHAYVDRLATVRLRSPVSGGVLVDLLFASSGIEPEITRDAEQLELVPGVVLPVARVAHLVALKLLARDDIARPQDVADLNALRRILTGEDMPNYADWCARWSNAATTGIAISSRLLRPTLRGSECDQGRRG